MLFLEIFLTLHGLIWLSSGLISRNWFNNQPTLKLKLARLLLLSCIISPLIMHGLNPVERLTTVNSTSLDILQDYANQPIVQTNSSQKADESTTATSYNDLRYYQLGYLLILILVMYRSFQLGLSFLQLKSILTNAISYRASRRLHIKVSPHCDIPFSVLWFNKAYIVLPVSLLASPKNVKIAIAHEGQHHRNGDCLWAYLLEGLNLFFYGNPGLNRWRRILNELQEFSCDEVLVGQPKISAHDYGHCLYDVVQTVAKTSSSTNREIACTVGMALGKHNEATTLIVRRISMLSSYPFNSAKPWLCGAVFAGFSIIAPVYMAYAAVGTLTGPKVKAVDTAYLQPEIQTIAEKEINTAVKKYQAKSGVIAVADVSTGHIVAFAETKNGHWKTRIFSPGSTIKPFIAAAAIESGKSSESKTYDCHSPYVVAGQTILNSDPNVKSLTLKEAIAQSNNVCLVKVALETGAPTLRKKLNDYGFDTNAWWNTNQPEELQLARASIGSTVPVSISSLTQSYVILANKGYSLKKQVMSKPTYLSINNMLKYAVEQGTGKKAAVSGLDVAGKTGTVGENQNNHLALFAGYAPADSPRYVMVVVIEEAKIKNDGEQLTAGGDLAAPVFHNVALSSLK